MIVPDIAVFAAIAVLLAAIVLGATSLNRRGLPKGRRMNAARLVALAYGIEASLLGFEHGFFETLQGDAAPGGIVISAIGPPCQTDTAWHSCEPALTIIPNFLVTGIVAMVVALTVLVVTVAFVDRRHGGTVLALLTVVLFLVGGGFTTLMFGVVGGMVGTRIDAPLRWWRAHLPAGLARGLAYLWPWLLVAYLAWASVSWVTPAYSNDLMRQLTIPVTIATPLLLLAIPVVGLAFDSRPGREIAATGVG